MAHREQAGGSPQDIKRKNAKEQIKQLICRLMSVPRNLLRHEQTLIRDFEELASSSTAFKAFVNEWLRYPRPAFGHLPKDPYDIDSLRAYIFRSSSDVYESDKEKDDGAWLSVNVRKDNTKSETLFDEETVVIEGTEDDETSDIIPSMEEEMERLLLMQRSCIGIDFGESTKTETSMEKSIIVGKVGETSEKKSEEIQTVCNIDNVGLDPLDSLDPRNMNEKRKEKMLRDLEEAMREEDEEAEDGSKRDGSTKKSTSHTIAMKYTILRGETLEWQNQASRKPYQSVIHQVIATCHRRMGRTFLEDVVNSTAINYYDFLKHSLIIRDRLKTTIGTNQLVMMFTDGSLDAWLVLFSVCLSGNKAAFVNPRCSLEKLKLYLRDTYPYMIYTDDRYHRTVELVRGTKKVLTGKQTEVGGRNTFFLEDWLKYAKTDRPSMPSLTSFGASDIRMLLVYPSLGDNFHKDRSHGIWYRVHDEAISHYLTVSQHNWDEKSKILIGCPMAFEHNPFLMFQAAISGCHVILAPGMNGAGQLKTAHKYLPTEWYSDPTSLEQAAAYFTKEYDLWGMIPPYPRSWRKICCFGMNLSLEDRDRLKEKLWILDDSKTSVRVAYGTTDSGLVSFHNLQHSNASITDTPGVVVSGVQIKIIDQLHRILPERTIGEICVKSPGVMRQHIKDTQNITSDGFLKTGDMGFIQDGHLYVCQRHTDTFARGMMKGSEMERRLNKIAGVRNSVVLWMQCPEEEKLKLIAFIMRASYPSVGKDEISAYAKQMGLEFDDVIFGNDLQRMLERKIEWFEFSRKTA